MVASLPADWKRGKIADFHVNAPMVLGHESAG